MTIHSSGQIISNLSHIEGITLGAGEEIYEVGDVVLDGIGEIDQG